jgi:general secretion pathway protein F
VPVFRYKALNAKGDAADGVIDADTPKEAREKLRGKSLFVTEMAEVDERAKRGAAKDNKEGKTGKITKSEAPAESSAKPAPASSLALGFKRFLKRKARAEVTNLTRLLATLLQAGIPLVDALGSMIQQVENKDVETVLRLVKEDVQAGATFADALARHPDIFDELYCNMVRAGEASGQLDVILKRLAAFLQSQKRMGDRVSAALTYPMIMSFLGGGIVVFLLEFVVPKITAVVTKRGTTLPLPTQILLTIQKTVNAYWWLIALVAITAFILYKMATSTEKGALWRDTTKLRLPIFGDLFRKQSVARFATTFATLLKSGIQATDALKILCTIVDNKRLGKVLEEVRLRIIEGADISGPIKKSRVFPPVVGDMIAIGEESGQLEELLDRIAEAYDEEIEITTAKVTSMIEPVIIVLMAFVVGFIVLAIILPLVKGFKF